MRISLSLAFALLMTACGSSPKPAAPSGAPTSAPPAPSDQAAAPRTVADCEALLEHVQSVSTEAIDRDGMLAACQDEWTDARADCLAAARNDDDVAACW
jgi:hypothetical protein